MAKTIAIQGGLGSFHYIAAREYFITEHIEVLTCESFSELFKSLNNSVANFGILAIENVIAGSILSNYKLLEESDLNILGEIYLRIKQNLMALSGQNLSDIKEVHSHPMALMQCGNFFNKHPEMKLIESIDTALSAKEIRDKKMLGVAAIAGNFAAELYNLEILQGGIETNKKNQTRFLVIGKEQNSLDTDKINKASLCFELPHKRGSLSQVLSVLAFYDINLTKIQSLPIIDKEWEYLFYIDLMFNNYSRYIQSIEAIKPLISKIEILGEYESGKKVLNQSSINRLVATH